METQTYAKRQRVKKEDTRYWINKNNMISLLPKRFTFLFALIYMPCTLRYVYRFVFSFAYTAIHTNIIIKHTQEWRKKKNFKTFNCCFTSSKVDSSNRIVVRQQYYNNVTTITCILQFDINFCHFTQSSTRGLISTRFTAANQFDSKLSFEYFIYS